MIWFVSNEIDSADEILHRTQFYSDLTGRTVVVESTVPAGYFLSDGHDDNRFMVVGHTNTIGEVLAFLRNKSAKKYKLYICSCAMLLDDLKRLITLMGNARSVHLATQDLIEIKDFSARYKDGIVVCEFVDKENTKLGFRATRSELNMHNSQLKGFFNKLDANFSSI